MVGYNPRQLSVHAAPIHPGSVPPGTSDTGGVDTRVIGWVLFVLDVGAFGALATVDFKLQDSADNSAFTDCNPVIAITQLVAAGGNNRLVSIQGRASDCQAGRPFLRARVTIGVAPTVVSCVPICHSKSGSDLTGVASALGGDIAAVAQRKMNTLPLALDPPLAGSGLLPSLIPL